MTTYDKDKSTIKKVEEVMETTICGVLFKKVDDDTIAVCGNDGRFIWHRSH